MCKCVLEASLFAFVYTFGGPIIRFVSCTLSHFLIPPQLSKRICEATVYDSPPYGPEYTRKTIIHTVSRSTSPFSHSSTLSLLQDIIDSMLGVLLETVVVQFQAVLTEFYLSGSLDVGKVVSDFDDDETHSTFFHHQVSASQ